MNKFGINFKSFRYLVEEPLTQKSSTIPIVLNERWASEDSVHDCHYMNIKIFYIFKSIQTFPQSHFRKASKMGFLIYCKTLFKFNLNCLNENFYDVSANKGPTEHVMSPNLLILYHLFSGRNVCMA